MPEGYANSTLFIFIDPATPEIYTLSLHDALPISVRAECDRYRVAGSASGTALGADQPTLRPLRWSRERPPLTARFAQDGQSTAQAVGLLEANEPGPLSRADRPPGLAALGIFFCSEPESPALS